MSRSITRRLDRLEQTLSSEKCQTCFDWPVRIVSIDDDMDTIISDNYPDDECPACGRPVRSQIQIVGVDALEV